MIGELVAMKTEMDRRRESMPGVVGFRRALDSGQEQVPQDEAHGGCCDMFVRGLGRRLPINFGLLDHCLLMM
uniref:Uncharacterized protein n=1 Tax=Zea mays TaxID=4577 RepID=B6SP05_MAIZE|nr:hypothetical protein [Zea mays]|eukprot:NP_001315043.1 uncharacterized protein LOC100275143 [Zea mays]